MKRLIFKVITVVMLGSSSLLSADFDWMQNLNYSAVANKDAYRAKLSSRFHMAKAQVGFFMQGIRAPADVYMVLRLSELSGRFPESVMEKYQQKKREGWGKIAQSLGIKPGSQEFQALKRGHDLQGFETKSPSKNKPAKKKAK